MPQKYVFFLIKQEEYLFFLKSIYFTLCKTYTTNLLANYPFCQSADSLIVKIPFHIKKIL